MVDHEQKKFRLRGIMNYGEIHLVPRSFGRVALIAYIDGEVVS